MVATVFDFLLYSLQMLLTCTLTFRVIHVFWNDFVKNSYNHGSIKRTLEIYLLLSRYLLVQSQHWGYLKNVRNIFKFSNKDTRKMTMS